MLEVDISKEMPGFELRASFSCGANELLALTGPSGAGKTTLVRILAGLSKADSGRISLAGVTWFDSNAGVCLPPQARQVGYVFQEHTLFPHLNIIDNLALVCKDKQLVGYLLDLFRIGHIAASRPHQVSGGERQRAAFAQALACGPKVLLLDEPFSALDQESRNRLQEKLLTLKRDLNMPIIHVTHDNAEAKLLADKSLYLDRFFSNTRKPMAAEVLGLFADGLGQAT